MQIDHRPLLQAHRAAGVHLQIPRGAQRSRERDVALEGLTSLGLGTAVEVQDRGDGSGFSLVLQDEALEAWLPQHDSLGLAERLATADPHADSPTLLKREIAAALLASPVPMEFPGADEFISALRLRAFTAEAAARTAMRFHTTGLERPAAYWTHDEELGFRLRPGQPLIEALVETTQPAEAESLYTFSCYRATEYVMLLALAQELKCSNPELLERLEIQWQRRPIASGLFHDVFLREIGSMEEPLPPRYYVPGDRVWFRNPDEASADASGYEGSWTFYLGGGRFANMWKRQEPFTLESKCLEIWHWRDATYLDAQGNLRMDEERVAEHVQRSQSDPQVLQAILERTLRLRDGRGVYAEGGCIDRTRECLRWVRAGTTDLNLPDA